MTATSTMEGIGRYELDLAPDPNVIDLSEVYEAPPCILNGEYSGYCQCDRHAGTTIILLGKTYCRCSLDYLSWYIALWESCYYRIETALKRQRYKDDEIQLIKQKLSRARHHPHHPNCEIWERFASAPLPPIRWGLKVIKDESPVPAMTANLLPARGLPELGVAPPPWPRRYAYNWEAI
jgi:hypothetical protein